MLHLDLDVIAQEEFRAVNVPDSGGLSFTDAQGSLTEFAKHKNLLGIDIAQYNPDKDPDGSCGSKLIDLLVAALSARLSALSPSASPPSAASESAPPAGTEEPPGNGESAAPPANELLN